MQASIPSSGILMLYDILYQTGAPQKYAHGIHTIIQVHLFINSKKKKKKHICGLMRTEQCGTSLSFIVGTVLFSP